MSKDQIVPERVVASGNRGVSCEDAVRGYRLEGGVERQPVCKMLAQQLENEKRGVPLVEMKPRRLDTQRTERLSAADAENHFLPDARRLVATVEAVRDIAVRRRVL